jgi:hypothetical protein
MLPAEFPMTAMSRDGGDLGDSLQISFANHVQVTQVMADDVVTESADCGAVAVGHAGAQQSGFAQATEESEAGLADVGQLV